MFKKIVTAIPAIGTSVSSGYTVPQGKVFILTGVTTRNRREGTHMNDSYYEWGYTRDLYQRRVESGSVYISNQLGNGFDHIVIRSSNEYYYEGNIIKWRFFLEGETIFISMVTSNSKGGEVTILWEEIDNV